MIIWYCQLTHTHKISIHKLYIFYYFFNLFLINIFRFSVSEFSHVISVLHLPYPNIHKTKSENYSRSNMHISRWHELSSCCSNYLSISYEAEWLLREKLQEYFPRSLSWPTGYRHFYLSSNSSRKSCQDRICTDISYISLEGSSHRDVKLPLLPCWA